MAQTPTEPLYESVARHIIHLIDGGTFRTGDRVPSVRALSRQLSVSVTTVLGAYRLLEDRAFIIPRPQSGYFVRTRTTSLHPASLADAAHEKAMCRPARGPSAVSVRDMVTLVMNDALNSRMAQFGAAIPNPRSLPTASLHRTLSRMTRLYPDRLGAYAIPPGILELRVQIARRALAGGCALTPDEILITSGGQEAITLCLQTLCNPGDTVALESPCYYGFLQAMEVMGIKGLEIPTHPRDGMNLDALALALKTHPVKAVLVIANFNNPLGSCMPVARKKQLVAMLAQRKIPLVEDDIYGDLYHHDRRPPTCKSFDKTGGVLLCDSFSKTLSPGLRIGWVAPGRYMDAIRYRKLVQSIATPTLPQLAIADFLANGGYERHLRALRRTVTRQTRALADAVLRYFPEGTHVTRPQGGHVLWVRMPPAVDAMKLYPLAIDKQITIAPGPMFSTKGLYRNFVRLNAAFYDETTDPAIKTLGNLVHALNVPARRTAKKSVTLSV